MLSMTFYGAKKKGVKKKIKLLMGVWQLWKVSLEPGKIACRMGV